MFALLDRWTDSGESRKEVQQREGMSQAVFEYWLRRYREKKREEGGGFVAVRLSPGMKKSETGGVFARLCLPDGRELRIEQAVSGAYLKEVLGW